MIINEVSKIEAFIKSVLELSLKVKKEDKCCIGRHTLFFRGHSSDKYLLLPSIAREIKGSTNNHCWLEEESNVVQLALSNKQELFKYCDSPMEILSVLQHYGLPTRLLDVTENALAALYFACGENKEGTDGEVIAMKGEYSFSNHPMYEGIAESYKLLLQESVSISDYKNRLQQRPYHVVNGTIFAEKPSEEDNDFYWMEPYVYNKPHLVYPPKLTIRQLLQDSRYLLFSNRMSSTSIEKTIEPLDKEDEMVLGSIIIKAESKKSLLAALEHLGVTKEKLFHDNSDVVLESIKQNLESKYH